MRGGRLAGGSVDAVGVEREAEQLRRVSREEALADEDQTWPASTRLRVCERVLVFACVLVRLARTQLGPARTLFVIVCFLFRIAFTRATRTLTYEVCVLITLSS